MQKTRCLMDKNDVSFQMFLILLSFITLGSESQILCSSNVKAIPSNLYFFGGGEHAQKPKFGDSHFFSEKRTS